jgi:hypothetical protein
MAHGLRSDVAFTRRTGVLATAALLVTAGGAGAAYRVVGGPSDPADAATVAGLPAGAAVEAVVAGDDEGWVLASRPDVGRTELWRIALDGRAAMTAQVPVLGSLRMTRVGNRLAIAGARCARRDGDACTHVGGDVFLTDAAGKVRRDVRLWEVEDETQPGGLTVAGSTADRVWIEHDLGISEVTRDGAVKRTLPDPGGNLCVVDGIPFTLRAATKGRDTTATDRSADPTGPTMLRAVRRVTVTHRIATFTGGAWRPVKGADRSVTGDGPVSRCTPDGYDVESTTGAQLLTSWSPGRGWRSGAGGRALAAVPKGAEPTEDATETAAFAVAADGAVLRRGRGGYADTGLQLPRDAVSGPSSPPLLSVDASDTVTAACVTKLPPADPGGGAATTTEATTTCDAVPRRPGNAPVAGSPGGTTPAAAPSGPRTAVHHYNVCNVTCAPTRARAAMTVTRWMFETDGAATLSVNEICSDRFHKLAARLGVEGRLVVSREDVSGCPPDLEGRKRFGNAVLSAGRPADAFAALLPTQIQGIDCADDRLECRTMVCVRTGDGGTCSSHLESGRDAVAQASEYLRLSTGWLGPGRRRWLAGDLNLTPDRVPAAYRTWRDVVDGNTYSAANPIRQLDYIWLAPGGRSADAARYCVPQASDHCWTKGSSR